MKSKEWIKLLVELHQNDKSDEYVDQAFKLHHECMDIVRARTGNALHIDPIGVTPLVNALREGAVKWEAVRHGVIQKLGEDAATFPLIEGGILLTILTGLSKRLQDVTVFQAQAHVNAVQLIVKGLQYDSIKWIRTILTGHSEALAVASAEEFIATIEGIREGKDISPEPFLERIKSLDTSSQLQAYYRIGQHFTKSA